jgi:hypothetical protein
VVAGFQSRRVDRSVGIESDAEPMEDRVILAGILASSLLGVASISDGHSSSTRWLMLFGTLMLILADVERQGHRARGAGYVRPSPSAFTRRLGALLNRSPKRYRCRRDELEIDRRLGRGRGGAHAVRRRGRAPRR